MFKKISVGISALCVLLLTGCIEFERQTLTYRYDAKSDTLRIFQTYHGIFGGDTKEKLSDEELNQLESVVSGHRTFFFNNWIQEYNAERMRQDLDNLKQPEAQLEKQRDPAAFARRETFFKLLLDNVHVENGATYLDDAGKLCGLQRVTLTRFSRVVAAANEQIRDFLKSAANEANATAEERALYLRFAEQKPPYIVLEGNQIRWRFPLMRAEYAKSFEKDEGVARMLMEFKRGGGSVAYTDSEMKWSLGTPSDEFTVLSLAVSPKPYAPNAVAAMKSRTVLQARPDIAAAAKEFVRGANLPAKPLKP